MYIFLALSQDQDICKGRKENVLSIKWEIMAVVSQLGGAQSHKTQY